MLKKKVDYKKIVFFWIEVFLVGGLAGIFSNRIFLPWVTSLSPFNKIVWLGNVNDGTTIINRTEKVYISQEAVYQEAMDKVGNAVVAVIIGAKFIQSSGFILTGDGLIATANFTVPKNSKILVAYDNKNYEAQLIKQNKANNLALLKIDANNLPVTDFGDSDNLRFGEKVFLIGAVKINDNFSRFVNYGFIKTLTPAISFTFTDSSLANGAPLSNIEGKVLGLVLVDKQGIIKLVGVDKIRELMK